MDPPPFWRRKHITEMNQSEWESLCDGCGKCCLHKLEITNTHEIGMTDVACRYLDTETCQCSDYQNRQKNVSDCVKLTSKILPTINWLPASCAYLRLDKGKSLPSWHHLVCGNTDAVHESGNSVRGKVISESEVTSLEEHVVEWLNLSEEVDWELE